MPCTPLGTQTPNLKLCKPRAGERGWADGVNGNWDKLDSISGVAAGAYTVQGLFGAPNGSTPQSQYDCSADIVVMRSPSNFSTITASPVGVRTVNLLTTGFGGLDSGAVAPNTFYHLYFVFSTVVSLMASTSAPPVGPALPAGGSSWAYAGAILTDGASHIRASYMRGSWMAYLNPLEVLTNGAALTPVAISVAGAVPFNALSYELTAQIAALQATCAAPGLDMRLDIGAALGGRCFTLQQVMPFATGVVKWGFPQTIVPNVGQQFVYTWTQTVGTLPLANLSVSRFQVANGDS